MIQILYPTSLKLATEESYLEIEGVDIKSMSFHCCNGEVRTATDFENGEQLLKRLHYANKPGVRCGNCGGSGSKQVHEDDRVINDACYHCSNTGEITWEQWQEDRLRQAAEVLAGDMTDNAERMTNSDPNGEGFAFHAAENGLSSYDYRQCLFFNNESRVMDALGVLWNGDHRSVAEVLVDRLVPAAKPKWFSETHVTWREGDAEFSGLTVRFDQPTDSYLIEKSNGEYMWVSQSNLSLHDPHPCEQPSFDEVPF